MLGPEGAGIFYLRKEHLGLLRPLGVGWNSVRNCFDFDTLKLDLKPTAARYEGGTMNTVGFLALGASLEVLKQQGVSARHSPIAEHLLTLGDYAVDCGMVVVPAFLADLVYDGVARLRYRIFGRRDEACPRLPEDLRGRFD